MAEVQQLADGTMRFVHPRDLAADMIIGGAAVPDGGANPRYISDNIIKITLQAAAGNGGVAAWQNPFPYAVDVVGTVVDVTTAGAGTVNVGTAANATTSSNNLVSGGSLTAVALVGSRAAFGKVAPGAWVTATASVTPTNLAGCLYLEFFPAT